MNKVRNNIKILKKKKKLSVIKLKQQHKLDLIKTIYLVDLKFWHYLFYLHFLNCDFILFYCQENNRIRFLDNTLTTKIDWYVS